MKFANDATIKDETTEEINSLAEWCTKKKLLLNVSKTRELIVDFQRQHSPVYIRGAEVEQVNRFRFLGINSTIKLTQKKSCSSQLLQRSS